MKKIIIVMMSACFFASCNETPVQTEHISNVDLILDTLKLNDIIRIENRINLKKNLLFSKFNVSKEDSISLNKLIDNYRSFRTLRKVRNCEKNAPLEVVNSLIDEYNFRIQSLKLQGALVLPRVDSCEQIVLENNKYLTNVLFNQELLYTDIFDKGIVVE